MGYKQKITDKQRRASIRTLKAYIDKYFHGDKHMWETRKEPYIFYKHLFRKFIISEIKVGQRVRDIEKSVTGHKPHHETIYASRDQDHTQFKLTKGEIKEAIAFMNKHFNMSVQQVLKTKMLKKINMGYNKEDIARHCMVHDRVIDNIMKDVTISEPLLRQIEMEL